MLDGKREMWDETARKTVKSMKLSLKIHPKWAYLSLHAMNSLNGSCSLSELSYHWVVAAANLEF